jgi:hypothetical protein
MVEAYRGGAKYVLVFNYPKYPQDNPFGILSENHFAALQRFWQYVHAYSRANVGQVDAQAVLVLPQDYGWGMRRSNYIVQDKIWGLWFEDDKAPMVLDSVNKLDAKLVLRLDINYEDVKFNYTGKFSLVYFWNSTTP